MGYSTRSKSSGSAAATAPPAKAVAKSTPKKPARGLAGAAAKAKAKVSKAVSSKGDGGASTFPDVPVLNEAGETISSADIVRDSGAVVFLYPRANTPGCTKQACGFRDSYDAIKTAGFKIYGLSYDSPKSQNSWAKKHELPYGFLCDTLDGGLIKALGAGKPPKGIKRSHFVVEKGGAILDAQIQISPGDSVAVAAKFIESRSTGQGNASGDKEEAPLDNMAAKEDKVISEPMDEDKPTGETSMSTGKTEKAGEEKAENGEEKASEIADKVKETEKPAADMPSSKAEVKQSTGNQVADPTGEKEKTSDEAVREDKPADANGKPDEMQVDETSVKPAAVGAKKDVGAEKPKTETSSAGGEEQKDAKPDVPPETPAATVTSGGAEAVAAVK